MLITPTASAAARRGADRRRRGQSLVEVALTAPVIIILILGMFVVGVLVVDKVSMVGASRQGARLAAELGGTASNSGTIACEMDQTIVQGVLAQALPTRFATVTEIDIYKPSSSTGQYTSGDPVNKYDGSGQLMASPGCTYTMPMRLQNVPNETQIGVRVVWRYSPPMPFILQSAMTFSDYTTMMMAPISS